MALTSGLQLQIIPAKILRQKCRKISAITPEITDLAQRMGLALEEFKGVGLAAPQINQAIRLIVVTDEKKGFIPMVNPTITFFSKEKVASEEGCLSIPNVYGIVKRAAKIRFSYQDLAGNTIKTKAKGLLSIIVQHECDHIDGILFIDKADRIVQGHDELAKMQQI
jgi:methionyl-tRNA formyltransferase